MRFIFLILFVLTSFLHKPKSQLTAFLMIGIVTQMLSLSDSNYDSSGIELEEISVTNDERYLYIRVKLNEEVDQLILTL